MKFLPLVLILMLAFVTNMDAQKKPLSPPMTASTNIEGVDMTIEYNAPSMRGRTIYGDLVPYNEIWRTGANGASKITLSDAMMIEGKELAAGTYSIFTIPGEKKWTVIFNKKANQWGHYSYSADEDALRVEVASKSLEDPVEQMAFVATDSGFEIQWENVAVPVQVKK